MTFSRILFINGMFAVAIATVFGLVGTVQAVAIVAGSESADCRFPFIMWGIFMLITTNLMRWSWDVDNRPKS